MQEFPAAIPSAEGTPVGNSSLFSPLAWHLPAQAKHLFSTLAQRNISATLFGNLRKYSYLCRRIMVKTLMDRLQNIFRAIDADGFKESTLLLIDEYINDIENGSTDFPRFNLQEHAGLCKAGSALIGASLVASYAARSIAASCHAEGREGGLANWEQVCITI